jgi:hypothetical protein
LIGDITGGGQRSGVGGGLHGGTYARSAGIVDGRADEAHHRDDAQTEEDGHVSFAVSAEAAKQGHDKAPGRIFGSGARPRLESPNGLEEL